jgi:hypothetical protein
MENAVKTEKTTVVMLAVVSGHPFWFGHPRRLVAGIHPNETRT